MYRWLMRQALRSPIRGDVRHERSGLLNGTSQAKRQHRADIDGAPRDFHKVIGHRTTFDDGEAPVVQADPLRDQLGAEPMSVAANPVDDDLVHQATATR